MPFLLLLVILPACLQEVWSDPPLPLSADRAAYLTWAAVVFVILVSAVLSTVVRRRLLRHPDQRELILARYGAFRTYFQFGLFALHGLVVYGIGWGWAVQSFLSTVEGQPAVPGAELLVMAPFLVALLSSWLFFFGAEKTFHETSSSHSETPFWTRGQYLLFQVRHNLALVAIPLGMVVLLKAVAWVLPGGVEAWGWAGSAGTMVAVLGCYLLMPWALRLLLGLRPLPDGPLRDRLMAAATRLRFRCSDILLWNTRGGVANALIVGLTPWLRYVVFTDRLIKEMTPDEVEAVFGHEVGHVKHWHMIYYLAFIKASMLAAYGGLLVLAVLVPKPYWDWLDQNWPQEDVWQWLIIGVVAVYIFSVFGFLSRRCERQADVFGCRAVSCGRFDCDGHDESSARVDDAQGLCPTGIRTMVNALEKVADLNGISRRRPGFLQSWQHDSIARRVEFLLRIEDKPALEPQFQWHFGWIKGALLFGLLGVFALCWAIANLVHHVSGGPG